MNMAGEQRIAAPRQRVWDALNNPEILRASIPGCQSLEKTANDHFAATVEVKVGPIGARFKGAVSLTDIQPAMGYTLNLEGNGGIAGSMKGSAKVRLSDDAGGTRIAYEVDAQIGGRMAQLGGPIIDATAKQLAGKFFSRLSEVVDGTTKSAETVRASTAVTSTAAGAVASSRVSSGGMPIAWILATVVAVLTGFLIGRSQGDEGSDWMGVAVGLLLIVVAGAAFEHGRRSASAVVILDNALLKRLLEGAKE